jgi:polysaccharide biosynthesis protein PslH
MELERPPRWIVVADSPFLPPRDGGEREHTGFVQAAAAEGRVAALVLPADPALDVGPYREATGGAPVVLVPRDRRLRHLVHRRVPFVVASRPAPSGLGERVAELAPDATGVVLFSAKARAVGEAVARARGLPTVLRGHNLEGPYHRALASGTPGPRKLLLGWEARRVDADELGLEHAAWLAGIADISATDAAVRAPRAGVPVAHVPPFAAGADPAPGHRGPRPGQVLFVGSLSVPTNEQALLWFLDGAWPRVRSAVPGATLVVVGRAPRGSLRRRLAAVPGATLHADVADVGPYMDASAVAIAPTVSGSGVNIKLVEYMLAGLPVVSTTAAARPLGLTDGTALAVADTPADFAVALSGLLTDPAGAEEMGTRGQVIMADLVDPRRSLAGLDALFAGTGAGFCGGRT